ncbi:MAG: hypothetical protein WHT45_03110 [Ignavibacterium sp.]
MKKLFSNYNFEFDKNERKLLKTFCGQVLKQVSGDSKFFAEEKAFNSIRNKLNSSDETIKLTKDEKIRLTHQLKQNVDFIKKQMNKGWFFKRWLYKSLHNQYNNLLEKHFRD